MSGGEIILENIPGYNFMNYYDRMSYEANYRSSEMRISMELQKALEAIRNSTLDEAEDAAFYKYLISIVPNEESKMIIEQIRDDEKKHGILLREVYYDLTGIEIPSNNMQSDKQFNMTYVDGLKQAFSNELKAMEKYRTILKSMESRKNYDKIFEIMTDEIKHAIKYSYLLQIAK